MSVMVERLWPGETVVILGAGPSLTADDVEYCHGKARVICLNYAYLLAPWADVMYSGDPHFWMKLYGQGPPFTGLKYGFKVRPSKCPDGVQLLQESPKVGLDRDPAYLCAGRVPGLPCSGYQAINLAVHLGASRILLLGYDLRLGANGRKNFAGAPKNTYQSPYGEFRKSFSALVSPLRQAGVSVINCSQGSALEWFPKMALRDALARVEVAA